MPVVPTRSAEPSTHPDGAYDRDAIFDPNGPLHPDFVDEAVRTLMRALPIDPEEPSAWADRRRYAALLGLAALHPRDEIEVMLAVQALSAYHAAASCWRIGMNGQRPIGDNTRHLASAGSAARTFDALLKALERRQAKPLSIPIGRPASRSWPFADAVGVLQAWSDRCGGEAAPGDLPDHAFWSPEALAVADHLREHEREAEEVRGLDLANTDGILPDGGMIVPEHPTPQQKAYLARRLGLMYRREYEANKRNGINVLPKLRTLRTGDHVP